MILIGAFERNEPISVPRVGGGDPKLMEVPTEKIKCSPRRRG